MDEEKDEVIEATPGIAMGYAYLCGKHDGESSDKVLKYLEGLGGTVERHTAHRIGLVLWDVRKRDAR
jgi:hypothetical protein